MRIRFLSLFSGIGGIDLGLERAGMQCVGQVEIDAWCRRVLRKHWPDVPLFDDIRKVTGDEFGQIDLIAGGFPCQDISAAGKGGGIHAARSGLWWEMHRITRHARPNWVLVENVPALRTRGSDEVIASLEELGYTCWSLVVGAWAVGAHHKRDRAWVIATRLPMSHPNSVRSQRAGKTQKESWSREQFEGLVQTALRVSVPAGKSGGVSDGISGRMDRLRGLGNAVVPQVVTALGGCIMQLNKGISRSELRPG